MSQENVEIVRRIYEAWNSGDQRAVEGARTAGEVPDPLGLELFDPRFELHQIATMLGTTTVFRGHDGLLRSAQELYSDLRDLSWKLDDFIPAPDDRVVVPFRFRATGRSSGVRVDMSLVHVWTLRGGLAIQCETYEDLAEALEAVGLSKQDAHADS